MKWIFGICVVAIAAGVVVTMTVPAQTITPDEGTLKLLPPDVQGVASLDVAALRSSSLIQDVLQKHGFPGGAQAFMDSTGFQPLRDVDKLTVAFGSKPVAIIAAHYDRAKFEQYFQNQGAAGETYLGRAIYSPGPQQMQSISLIDNFILAGDTDMVKQVIDRMAAPAPSVLQNTTLMDMIRKIETGNQVWVVGGSPDIMARIPAPIPAQFQDVLKSWTSGAYQMRIAGDVHIKAIGNFADADSAKNSADLLRGFVALARTQSAQQPNLVHLLDGVRIENAGASMTVQVDEPGDLLKSLEPKKLAELVK
jgi:hypothetical protein